MNAFCMMCGKPLVPDVFSDSPIGVAVAVLSIIIFVYRSGEVLQGKLTALLQGMPLAARPLAASTDGSVCPTRACVLVGHAFSPANRCGAQRQ